jgi:hypothetical protein
MMTVIFLCCSTKQSPNRDNETLVSDSEIEIVIDTPLTCKEASETFVTRAQLRGVMAVFVPNCCFA